MSKAVLVMDMPSSCEECHLLSVGRYCKGKEAPNVAVDSHLDKSKPDWCPLKPMPEKKEDNSANTESFACFKLGYNACIDELLGEEHGKNSK